MIDSMMNVSYAVAILADAGEKDVQLLLNKLQLNQSTEDSEYATDSSDEVVNILELYRYNCDKNRH